MVKMLHACILAALAATGAASRSNPYIYGAVFDSTATRSLQQADLFDFPDPLESETVTLTVPVAITRGKRFDGKGRRYIMASPDQPLFRVFNGTVQDVVVGEQLGQGIRCFGDCSILDVYFENVGLSNAISLSSTATPNANVAISGGGVKQAADVAISLNSGASVTISDYVFDGCRTGVYASETFKTVGADASITITDSTARYTDTTKRLALAKTPSSGLPSIYNIANVTIINAAGRPVCRGPSGACSLEDIRYISEQQFTEEADQ